MNNHEFTLTKQALHNIGPGVYVGPILCKAFRVGFILSNTLYLAGKVRDVGGILANSDLFCVTKTD